MGRNILVVEDDRNICDLIHMYLVKEGFDVRIAGDGGKAIEEFQKQVPDLILLDIMLPVMDGWSVCAKIRETSKVPIIMLTAKGETFDKVLGLELGSDDYVVKPFSLIELTARIKANIRRARTYQAMPNDAGVKIKDLEIDPISHTVSRQGTLIDLTPIEFEILHLLATHPGRAFSKERLYELIWKEPYFGNENVLNTHINRLRLKLKNGEEDTTTYIKTLWGIGYKMEDK